MENDSLNNGHVIEITPEIFEKAANDFSEGNEALRKLLMFCFENDIATSACCSGHNGEKRPYIQFKFDEKNMKGILKILKQISLDDAVSNFTFMKQPGVTAAFCVSMKEDKFNEGFEQVLEALQYEKEVDISELDETRQLMLKSMQNHSVSNEYLELQEENDSVAIAVGEDYWTVFPSEQETKQWIEHTMIGEYQKDSKEVKKTLSRLESKTKNLRYIAEHPYDSEKVNELWASNSLATIEINGAATMERQSEYVERNVLNVDVLPGSSIEALANEIMRLHQYGQACITRFNSFVIDSRDYTNPDEIVQAYMKEYERQKTQREEQQKAGKDSNEFITTIQEQVVSNSEEYIQNINNLDNNRDMSKENTKEEI